ncbi:hypothetical protein DFH09DRAFT_1486340 [Mycena vulgaris]|nr:hypothetical protein DFH09DRAFT_1486340 [Mycena vulgaris]
MKGGVPGSDRTVVATGGEPHLKRGRLRAGTESSAARSLRRPRPALKGARPGLGRDERSQTFVLVLMKHPCWATDQKTVTYIWDIKDLSQPVLTGRYKSPIVAVDHNLYVHNSLVYESNYKSGLRIVEVSSVADDPTGADFFEAAFFDAHPEDDAVSGEPSFGGVWSTYPHFESGYILVNTLERGLFVVKYNETA